MSKTLEEYIETGTLLDNRGAERKDVTEDFFHPNGQTLTCPHCGCTLGSHVITENGYCYRCGGGFSKVKKPKEHIW